MKNINRSFPTLALLKSSYSRLTVSQMLLLAATISLAALTGVNAQPTISVQPEDQFVDSGSSLVFDAASSTAPPLTYQWFFNGLKLVGATNQNLLFTNVQPAATGDYFAVVSNANGSTTSRVARLKVFVAAGHGLRNITLTTNRSVALRLAGETPAQFAPYYDLHPLEVSSNLVDWTPLVTLVRTNAASSALSFLDSGAPQFPQRFYRTPTNLLMTPFPKPTGPYPVGTVSRKLTDPSRTNRRPFMISIWYPAITKAGVLPDLYVNDKVAEAITTFFQFDAAFTKVMTNSHTFALPDVPVATSPMKFPIVIYSHGVFGRRTDNSDKAVTLASHGYVVVGIDHEGAVASAYPDGTIIYENTSPFGPVTGAIFQDKVQDISFVMDELNRLNGNDSMFATRLDLDRIGVFGWSYGGAAAAEVCSADARCKAGVSLDAGAHPNPSQLNFNKPFLIVQGGDGDNIVAGYGPDFRELFDRLTKDAYWVSV